MTHLVGAKALAMLDDINGYRGLISATVKQAITDAMIPNDRANKTLNKLSADGLDFLFGNNVDIYLHFLNIDKDYFQKHLVQEMFNKNTGSMAVTEIKKRMFRINYRKWIQEKNAKLIFMATYKVNRQ